MLVQFRKSGVFVDLPSIRPDSIGQRFGRKVVGARVMSVNLVVSSGNKGNLKILFMVH